METKIDYKVLQDFSEGKYSWNDYLKVKQLFSTPGDLHQIEEQLFDQWKNKLEQGQPDPKSLRHLFEKIHYQILLEERQQAKKRKLWNTYRQIAAILLIPVLIFSAMFYFFSNKPEPVALSWATINAPQGSRVEFSLPDGSKGWLNSGSTLKYPVIFGQQRRVELAGEAFFDISHLDKSDFTVSVADLQVKVLGTTFNISAYPTDNYTEVVLKEGKVDISGTAAIFSYTMAPGEKMNFNRDTQKAGVKKVDSDLYSVWKDGYLVLDNETMGQAISRIERWYNAEIIVQNDILKKYRFKATFKDEPLEEVLHLLSLTTPIKYSIEKRITDREGVYAKKKVVIQLRK